MQKRADFMLLLLSFALVWGCSSTVLVPVPPRMDLRGYGTLGIIEFSSNADPAINAHATRRFQEHIQAAQPGTRFIELGSRDAVLAALGSKQFDVDTLKQVGAKYGVDAIFLGDVTYSEPKTDIDIRDLTKLDGKVRTEIRGDMTSRLLETRTGASVWSDSAWATRQIGRLSISAEQGVSGRMSQGNDREEMLPTLIHYLTGDFRPTSIRQRVK